MANLLTVVVMTYNQVDYIAKAIDSILEQSFETKFNILIHDDCSDDGTYEILLGYQKKYPDMITIIRQKTRQFIIQGFNKMIYNFVVPNVNSEYIAYCDGDDYWIDKHKLQKQYNYMTEHPNCSMCFHSAYQLRPNNDMSSKWFIKKESDISISDILNEKPGVHIATSSIFLKTSIFKDFSDWRLNYPVEDIPMYLTAVISGEVHCLSDIMCVYRQFSAGSWSSQNQANKNREIEHMKQMIVATDVFDSQTDYKYTEYVQNYKRGANFRIALLTKNYDAIFMKENRKLFKEMVPQKQKLSLKLQYYHPHLYNLLHNKRRK